FLVDREDALAPEQVGDHARFFFPQLFGKVQHGLEMFLGDEDHAAFIGHHDVVGANLDAADLDHFVSRLLDRAAPGGHDDGAAGIDRKAERDTFVDVAAGAVGNHAADALHLGGGGDDAPPAIGVEATAI